MPGPYTNFYSDSLSGGTLTHLGGYSKADTGTITDANLQVSAEETNKQIGALVDIVARDKQRVIDPRDFGVVYGNVSQSVRIANKTNLRTALARAISEAKPLFFAPGAIQCEIESSDTRNVDAGGSRVIGLYINGDVDFLGSGRDISSVTWYPTNLNFTCDLLYVDSFNAARKVTMSNMTWGGQTSIPATGSVVTSGITTQAPDTASPPEDILRLVNVKLTGRWRRGINSIQGNTLIDLFNCEVDAYRAGIKATCSTPTKKHINVVNCYIHDLTDAGGLGTGIEPDSTVAVYCAGTRFKNHTGAGIEWQSVAQTTIPDYSVVQGCSFDSDVQYGLITTKNGTTNVTGCTFLGDGSQVVGNLFFWKHVNLTANTFNAIVAPTAAIGASGGPSRVIIQGCQFNWGAGGTSAVSMSSGQTTTWIMTGCQFIGSNASADGMVTATNNTVLLQNSYFGGSGRSVMQTSGTGTQTISDCYNDTTMTGFILASGDGITRVERNVHLGGGTFLDANTSTNHIIFAHDNNAAGIGSASGSRQDIHPRRAIKTTAIASAATLTLTYDFDTFFVSGTATINTIRFGNNDNEHKGASGLLRIIATGAFTVTNAGNLRLRGGAASRLVAVDEVLIFVVDSTTALLYEQ